MNFLLNKRYWAVAGAAFVLILLLSGLRHSSEIQSLKYSPLPSLTGNRDILDDIYNSTLGFQKIFVINLPSRTDLRDAVTLAAAFTGLQVEFVDGVVGSTVANKTLPPGGAEAGINAGGLGNWRAHMNVARIIVEQNIQSALVLENDADWDLRIKSQMRDFARASRLLVQPLKGTNDTFLDPTNPDPKTADGTAPSFDVDETDPARTLAPTTSPYGDLDRWDMLWLGHCGCRFPWKSDENAPLGRAVIAHDVTVPEHQHFDVELGDRQLVEQYPAHTRVVSRARVNSCTLGHAFSQKGARLFLYEFAVRQLNEPTDMLFRSICDGVRGRPLATCLTVQPQLFQHHRPRGSRATESDISDHGEGFNAHAQTPNVRWSTRINFPRLTVGRTDYIDLYPDGSQVPRWAEDQV